MTENQFKIIFDYVEEGLKEQEKLQSDEVSKLLQLNNEIKLLSEIINESIPSDEPLIYSSS